MTSNTYQETVVSHELPNLFQQICCRQFSKIQDKKFHITKKKMQISDVCSTSKVKHWQKEKIRHSSFVGLAYYPRQGYCV
jgi:hypothetical protein